MKRTTLLFLLLIFLLTVSFGQKPNKEYIIQVTQQSVLHNIMSSFEKFEYTELNTDFHVFLLKLPPEITTTALNKYFLQQKGVIYFNENHRINNNSLGRCSEIPNDSLFSQQWSVSKINTEQVWCKSKGGATAYGDSIVIGVLEANGFAFNHKDLIRNIYKNKAEIPNNKIDDDGNGYIDDYFGISCKSKTDSITPHSHGAGVLGILGAEGGNYSGVTGINQSVKLLMASDAIFESDWITGLGYFYSLRNQYNNTLGKKGLFIPVVNISAGFDNGKANEFPILCNLLNELGKIGILIVNAVPNTDRNIDDAGDIPGDCASDFLITVTNSTNEDFKYLSAAFGKKNVDMAAPGDRILTTSLQQGYNTIIGCSASAPHVSGAIALLYSLPIEGWMKDVKIDPQKAALKMKDFIMKGVAKNNDLEKYTLSGGRLDVAKSMQLMEESYPPIEKIVIKNAFPNPSNQFVTFKITTNSYETIRLEILNELGQILDSFSFTPSNLVENEFKTTISSYPNGLYIAKFSNTKNLTAVKFVVLQ